jgi:glycosyltransferase involved in cell wall biosynthesis
MDRPVRRGFRTRLVYGQLVARAVAISPAVRDALIEGGVPPEKVELIPSAVDPSRGPREAGDARRATRRALEAADGSVVVLALASLVRRKGIDVLLEALARIAEPGVVAWIAGDGPERAELEAQAERLGLGSRVRFLGRREDAAELLAGCDLLALPSRREGLGVSALEAMAARRPVVASRVGGLADAVVEGRTGLLVAPGDPEALRLAIARLAEDADLRRRLGEGGPSRLVEGFLAPQMVLAYEKLYRSVLEERKRS